MTNETLTSRNFWEDYWKSVVLPQEISKADAGLYLKEILSVFDRHLEVDCSRTILEIGGAPGKFLAYMHKNFDYEIHSLDYSESGCAKTRENFELLGISGTVHQNDFFSDKLDLPKFDCVYSLGFFEHFTALGDVIERHVRLLKPGGLLIIGAPNFLGVNHFFLKRLSPNLLSKHCLPTMNIANWGSFEKRLKLECLFKGYVGGFEPSIFNRCEIRTVPNSLLLFGARVMCQILHRRFRLLRKLNSRYISGYVMGVFRKPQAATKILGSPALI